MFNLTDLDDVSWARPPISHVINTRLVNMKS